MKKILFGFIISCASISGFAQDIAYDIKVKQNRPITSKTLEDAQFLSDIISDYPSNWVKDYISVEVIAKENENIKKAIGTDKTLNDQQKKVLSKAALDSEVEFNVWYKSPNTVTDIIENRNMFVKMTVVPDFEADFEGGYAKLKLYLKENLINNIYGKTPLMNQKGKVVFTINELGMVENPEISLTSGDAKTDKLIIKVLKKMPKWKPAQTAQGQKVKQKFEFSMSLIGLEGC